MGGSEADRLSEAQRLRLYEALIQRVPAGMCVLDRALRYVLVNPALEQINGVPAADHLGRTVAEIVPNFYAEAETAIAATLDAGKPVVDLIVEADTPAHPGQPHVWKESWYPIDVPELGRLMAVIVRDVTDERRLTERLEEAARQKDEFLALLGHELRNPLAPIANVVSLLKTVDHPLVQRLSDILDRQQRQLVRLVHDLTDASRIRTGKLEITPLPLDLRSVIGEAVTNTEPLRSSREQHLELAVAAAPLPVTGDADRLTQVLSNVLNNASKFTPPGGRIALRAGVDGDDILVAVSDEGCGLEPGQLSSIFERFMQGDSEAGGKASGGLGLGLWLARHLVEKHHGRIEASSPGPGHGSTFTIRLPRRS